MVKHTSGPWRVAKVVDSKHPTPHVVYVLIDDGRKRNVCAVSVYGRDEQNKPTKTRRVAGELRATPSIGDDECKANAHLIAAAPDLLEAAEIGAKWMEWWLDQHECECLENQSTHICGQSEREKEIATIRVAIDRAYGRGAQDG